MTEIFNLFSHTIKRKAPLMPPGLEKVSAHQEPVRVLFHLNGGYTRVGLERLRIEFDIPTSVIPTHLRTLGSRFLLIWKNKIPKSIAEIEELRKQPWCRVEEIPNIQE